MSELTWIQLIDKHSDGFGFIAFLVVVGATISVVAIALAIAEFAHRRK